MSVPFIVGVLIAGVLDYKRPLERPKSGDWIDLVTSPTLPFRLSPFDEAALECALKLRDTDANTRIGVIVTQGGQDVSLLRHLASFRPDSLTVLHPGPRLAVDISETANRLKGLLNVTCPGAELWMIGREHGDFDDGLFAGYLAATMGMNQIEDVITVQRTGSAGIILERVTPRGTQRLVSGAGPLMVSITNDQGNRLRHPLMKNIALAKQQKFEIQPLDADPSISPVNTQIQQLGPATARVRRDTPCQTFSGDEDQQASQLLDWLLAQRNPSKAH